MDYLLLGRPLLGLARVSSPAEQRRTGLGTGEDEASQHQVPD